MNIMGFQAGAINWGDPTSLTDLKAQIAAQAPFLPEGFIDTFLAAVALEDLVPLTPSCVALLLTEAWSHVSSRPRGQSSVRIFNPELHGGPVTVIEAVNDDMAFLYTSVVGEVIERGLELKLAAHPILHVDRDAEGRVTGLEVVSRKGERSEENRESLIHIHVPAMGEAERAQLKAVLETVLADVGVVNDDFAAMRKQVRSLSKGYRREKRPYDADAQEEAADVLEWLTEDNFVFLGLRHYELLEDGSLRAEPNSGLGILRDPVVRELRLGDKPVVTPPEIRAFLEASSPLHFTKASLRSRVHRRDVMDYVGIKAHDDDGRVVGEVRLIGLFTATAYTQPVREIPYLRLKAASVVKEAGLEPASHSAHALQTLLETYPRDDLFQISTETLLVHAREILSLYDRPRLKVMARADRFDRFVSVLVFLPRERFDAEVRDKTGAILARAFGGRVASVDQDFVTGIPLIRVHFIIDRSDGRIPEVDRAALEQEVADAMLSWSDRLGSAISALPGTDREMAARLKHRYAAAFGPGYEAAYDVTTALADIDRLERLSPARPVALDFYRRPGDDERRISLRLLSFGAPLPLSTRVPMLENMGLKAINERSYRIEPAGGAARSWLHDMTLERADSGSISLAGADERLEDCLNAVLRGAAEDDGYNGLVLDAALSFREAALVRTLGHYIRQAGIPFSQDYIWQTLNAHGALARAIVALFHARFDPALDASAEARVAREAPLRAAIDDELSDVSSLDQDRILRRFVNLVDAAIRTTFYQRDADGRPKEAIAIKFESAKVEGLALPRPLYEVFVYAPRVEGVHLRFGKVARGGLRWSDRPQDFRTEVLGLVKAQQVKNAVIVPVGAKGGFVPKRLPAGGSREAVMAEGTAAYEIFVSSLLDLTDNLKGGQVVHPANTVRLDADDPYLVVAADKGTATFSDTANAISARHGFWLDDAFASGGSVGYDHKAMGITARGAWEAVKRHFREMDIDIQVTPVTVAGVGDMSGDVFGNGMLLSRALKLVAAFDHRHIFIDPTPDPAASFAERQRLFNLPRSSWADYDASLISKGGGVFPRSAKSIELPDEVRALLRFPKAHATPAELITAILKAQVDLLFFGGIGTYVRASGETDAQVGDRANDAVRIAAADLGAKVVGEGANLGMTQRSRIEAARRGVKLNTDAIDNSAGVNTSDVEVNIKIALSLPLERGDLTAPDRAALLKEMTDEVGTLVLRNNYLQTLALSLAEHKGADDLAFQQRLMQMLEARGELDRAVEFLPSDAEIADRRSRGEHLTRPELAVLLAYAKLALDQDLVASNVPDDAYLSGELVNYFPREIKQRYPHAIETHRLHREIIATGLSNAILNQGGPSCLARIADQTGADAPAIARAFAAVRDSYHVPELNAAIDALDTKVPGAVQLGLYAAVQDLVVGRTIWFLGNVSFADGIAGVVERYRTGIAAVAAVLEESLPEAWRREREARMADLIGHNVPEELARKIAFMPGLAAASDIALIAETTGKSIPSAASTFFAAGRTFAIDDLFMQARSILAPDYYDRLALDRSLAQLETFMRRITELMLVDDVAGEAAVNAFICARHEEVERMRRTVREIAASGLSLSKLTLAASLLSDLVRS
ncbi:NAD-glutamate dehydrogenase [Xanthobacter autotrophicus]|uniref:NAD-glutamate dehydrogenase n=1 Tax=Xanthobacter autotrophicus TaxID=280 RepID=UPI0024A667F6|nr:NAD-glutamate dehydrogenase [Xanthobacter autotrophicus]MDI4655954.1 NAD-glutamate dehydrogenase [Xanthobacter autotrophicus]